eukprot:jgi/Hompol1/1736/HPOL_005705-RA
MSIPTPDLSHLNRASYERVYEPAEDTFLLLDALEADADRLRQSKPTICVEVGSGSGCVTTFLGMLLGASNALYLCTDINEFAAQTTLTTGSTNKIVIDCVATHFTDALHSRISRSVDILIFNPPYVVTPTEEVGSRGIEAAWAGGIDGREVVDRFMPIVPSLLSDHGVFYLVAINQNKPAEIMEHARTHLGLLSTAVLKRRAGYEGLWIIRFERAPVSC